jgi:hypothetical protein
MNFETKYLIRWGIPGWILLFWVAWIYINSHDISIANLFDGKQNIAVILSLLGLGVPIGYVLHQLHFLSFWIASRFSNIHLNAIKNKIENFEVPSGWTGRRPEDYFYIEYLWQRELSKLDEIKMNYLSERYRHLLSTTHSLGALFESFFIPCLGTLMLSIVNWDFNLFFDFIFLGVLSGVALINYSYYSKKTLYFQGRFLNDFINGHYKTNE